MNVRLLIPIVLVLTVIPWRRAGAQEREALSIGMSYEFGVPVSIDRNKAFGVGGWCVECNGLGDSYEHTVSFPIGLRLPGILGGPFGLDTRLALAFASGRFTTRSYTVDTVVGQVEMNASPTSVTLDLLADYPFGEWRAQFGPWLDYRVGGDFVATERLLSPLDARFPDGKRDRVVASGDRLASSPTAYGLASGISYDISSGAQYTFRAGVHARVDAGALADGLGLRAFSIGLGGAMLVNLSDGSSSAPSGLDTPAVAASPPTLDPSASASPRFDVGLELYGMDGQRNPLPYAMIEPLTQKRVVRAELLPTVFFDENSGTIPARYIRLAPSEAATFTIDSLARRSSLELYHNLLNIVGERMSRWGNSRITLRASVSDGEPGDLARRRGEAVREYLFTVWGIDRSRIEIAGAPRNQAHGSMSRAEDAGRRRCVDIKSEFPNLLEPVVTTWIEKGFAPPMIGIAPAITAESGVGSWTVTVRQGDRVIQRQSSIPEASDASAESISVVGDGGDLEPTPLTAELVVVDSQGVRMTARDTLALRVRPDVDRESWSSERTEYLILPLADIDDLRTRLRLIADAVRGGATVTVASGVADGSGGEPGEAELVWRELRSMLGPKQVEPSVIEPIRSTVEEMPELRALESAVRIIVDQKAV